MRRQGNLNGYSIQFHNPGNSVMIPGKILLPISISVVPIAGVVLVSMKSAVFSLLLLVQPLSTFMAVKEEGKIYLQTACSRSTPIQAKGSGITNLYIMIFGTVTYQLLPPL